MTVRRRYPGGKPVLGITMGDPAGIGPEIIVRALSRPSVRQLCFPIVVGDQGILERAGHVCGRKLRLPVIPCAGELRRGAGPGAILDLGVVTPGRVRAGRVSRAAGEAAYRYLVEAIRLTRDGLLDAIVTAPLNKEALNRAGHRYAGHAEILARETGTRDFRMMLVSGPLRISHVTCHVSLSAALRKVRRQRVRKTIELTLRALPMMGARRARVAVAGLNPHAGEGGLFGKEERTEILPVVKQFRRRGFAVTGPCPPDTVFMRALRGEFDAVVAMYHDQGCIALKTCGFERGVNVTIGLPLIRTSVDHGTAFDIAGLGTADETSLVEAIRLAAAMVQASRIR